MDYSPYNMYNGASSYGFPHSDSALPQLQLLRDESGSDSNMHLDPKLNNVSPPAQPSAQWMTPYQPATVERFLADPHKTALIHLGPPLHSLQGPNMMRPVTALPSASSQRHGSPFSHNEQCSTGSSALSPGGESEYYFDNIPSTPSDCPPLPRFQTHAHYDSWDATASFYQFHGKASQMAEETCVPTMLEVNPSQDAQFEYSLGNDILDLTPMQRGFSLQSGYSMQFEMDHASNVLPTDFPKRMSSPEEMPETKDAIYIPDSKMSLYPALGDDGSSDADDAESLVLKKEEDEEQLDSDYKPNKKPTSSRRAPATPASRKKATKRPRSDEKPTPKRAKLSASAIPQTGTAKMPAAPSPLKGSLQCPECRGISFKDASGLQNHIKKQHTRPFTCVFAFAGCDSTFASKNEWKRHVMSQHLLLTYWLCTQGDCRQTVNGPSAPPAHSHKKARAAEAVPALPNGAIFNRKDLYTQHIRRMHTPPQIKKATRGAPSASSGKKSSSSAAPAVADWEERLRGLQREAARERCRLPDFMACPVRGCEAEFSGVDAWDQRMEHVARHLEAAAAGKEAVVGSGGEGDGTLMGWATRADVGVVKRGAGAVGGSGEWVLNNPLRPAGAAAGAGAKGTVGSGRGVIEVVVKGEDGDEDVDGECEDDDDAEGEPDN